MEEDVIIDSRVLEKVNKLLENGDLSKIYGFITTHTLEEVYPLVEYLWESGDSLYNLGYADYVYQGCYNDLFYGGTVKYLDIIKMRRSFESVINHHNSLGCLQFLSWFLEKSVIHRKVMISDELIEKDFGYEIFGSFRDLVFRANDIASVEYPLECSEIMEQLPEWLNREDKVLIKKNKV